MTDQKEVATLFCTDCKRWTQYYGPTSENYCQFCGTQNATIQQYQNILHKQKETEMQKYEEECKEDLYNFGEVETRINNYFNDRQDILNRIQSLYQELETRKCEIDVDFKEETRFQRHQQNSFFEHNERIKDMEIRMRKTICSKLKIEWRTPLKMNKPVMNTQVIINPNFTGMFVISLFTGYQCCQLLK